MKISAKADYACRALLELSFHWPSDDPLPIQTIAKRQRIPIKYLVQILMRLREKGYVMSIRGQLGGYRLRSAPRLITLGEVIRDLGEPLAAANVDRKNLPENDVFRSVWEEVDKSVAAIIDDISFEDVAEKSVSGKMVLDYQI